MILKILPLMSLLFLTSCDNSSAVDQLEKVGEEVKEISEDIQSAGDDLLEEDIDEAISVYISKGNTQCNDDGLTIVETTSYLTNADIAVSASQCGFIEGISFASVCGGGTGDIYIHTINNSDLTDAENLGFTGTSLLASENLSYTVIECPSL